ncbi:hypothetical protein D9C73_003324 [Collichthys lucidus]|uniref:Uncharacterized protein n=1 Tax=Collichthys lucidus TaxID=240159 RepID=A0A4U5U5Z4_COLLU|nr:hypothetical protein D9C73_003324 [Collichthys lucidus]
MRTTLDCFKQLCGPAELLCYPGSLASSSYTPFITCFQWPPPSRLRLEGQTLGCETLMGQLVVDSQTVAEWPIHSPKSQTGQISLAALGLTRGKQAVRSWSYNRSVNRGGRTYSSCTMLRKDWQNPGPPTGNWQSGGGCEWAAMVRQYPNSGGRGYRGYQGTKRGVGGHPWERAVDKVAQLAVPKAPMRLRAA